MASKRLPSPSFSGSAQGKKRRKPDSELSSNPHTAKSRARLSNRSEAQREYENSVDAMKRAIKRKQTAWEIAHPDESPAAKQSAFNLIAAQENEQR